MHPYEYQNKPIYSMALIQNNRLISNQRLKPQGAGMHFKLAKTIKGEVK